MEYILKNKDKNVISLKVGTKKTEFQFGVISYEQFIEDAIILEPELLPLPLQLKLEKTEKKEAITDWIISRKAPNNRMFVDKIIETYGGSDKTFMDYVDVSYALSVNDSYWIVPDDENEYLWKNYNLYDNKFNKVLELVAFAGNSCKISGFTSSPEYTTTGMLRKCWNKESDGIYLYKGSTQVYANGGKDAYSEYYCSQIANILGFEAVPYNLIEFHNQIASRCPLFTNEDEGYIPIYYCISNLSKGIESEREIASIYGQEQFEDLMLFDGLIGNKDRHFGNFGMIINNNTNKILRPAPIFDNGASFLNLLTLDDFKNYKTIEKDYRTYFGYTPTEQIKIYFRERHIPALERLISTPLEYSRFREFDNYVNAFEHLVKSRAIEILELAKTLINNDNLSMSM